MFFSFLPPRLSFANQTAFGFLFLALRQARKNWGKSDLIEHLVPALELTRLSLALSMGLSFPMKVSLPVWPFLRSCKEGHVVRTVYGLMFYS